MTQDKEYKEFMDETYSKEKLRDWSKEKTVSRWNTKHLLQVLQNFAKGPKGAEAKVVVALPKGRAPGQDNFEITEIKLVDNPMIGAKERHFLVIFLQ